MKKFEDVLITVFVCMVIFCAVIGWLHMMDFINLHNDQPATCAVLSKHVPNRSPQVINGECYLLVGVDEPREMMTVSDYGRMILEDEK